MRASHLECIRALSDILIPRGGTIEASASDAGVPELIASWIDGAQPTLRRRFKLLISAWDLGPVAAWGFMKPFHRLDPNRQVKWIDENHHSRFAFRRAPITYLKQLIYLAYASTPQVEEQIGFDYSCRLDAEPHARRMASR